MSPLDSDGLPAGEKPGVDSPVLSRAQRRQKGSHVVDDSVKDTLDDPSKDAAGVESDASLEVSPEGDSSMKDEDFDIMSLPAPLADPDSYGRELIEREDVLDEGSPFGEDSEDSPSVDVREDGVSPETLVGWDIIFPEGENPRMLVRAALLTDDEDVSSDGDSVPVVESSVELSAEDVDRLLKLAYKVEKYHSRSSRFGRRVFQWVMRRKFFAGVTFAILMYLGISEAVRAFT